MKNSILSLALGATTVSAHFVLDFPTARGFDEDKLGNFPCGGQDTASTTRTLWPMANGQIALTMGHDEANVQVLIGLGNNPGSAFNTIIKPTFSETGLGAFCIEGIDVPGMTGVADGMNATIQVVTDGEDGGGLYNCADITFSTTATTPSSSICKNNTGVSTSVASSSLSPNLTSAATESATSAANRMGASIGAGFWGLVLGMGLTIVVAR